MCDNPLTHILVRFHYHISDSMSQRWGNRFASGSFPIIGSVAASRRICSKPRRHLPAQSCRAWTTSEMSTPSSSLNFSSFVRSGARVLLNWILRPILFPQVICSLVDTRILVFRQLDLWGLHLKPLRVQPFFGYVFRPRCRSTWTAHCCLSSTSQNAAMRPAEAAIGAWCSILVG
jgi:hypothetical protein